MKKLTVLAVLSLALICIHSSSFAQIRVLGDSTSTDANGAGTDGNILPVEGKPGDCIVYDPNKYINELRAKTLDQYADQIAENLNTNLQACGGELLSSVTEYTIPSIEVIKASFFEQVQSFGYDDVTSETNLGDFVDRVAQGIIAKISSLSGVERQVLGIYYLANQEAEQGKSLAMQTIWTLENLTSQKYYTELYSLLDKYMKWPEMYENRDPNAKAIDSTGNFANTTNDVRVNSTKQERN